MIYSQTIIISKVEGLGILGKEKNFSSRHKIATSTYTLFIFIIYLLL